MAIRACERNHRPPARLRPRRSQPLHQILRNEGSIRGNRGNESRLRLVPGRPAHPGQNTGQRSHMPIDCIGHVRQAECREPGRITVDIDHQGADLRRQPGDDVCDHRLATDLQQPLVATTGPVGEHPPRLSAGQQHADHLLPQVAQVGVGSVHDCLWSFSRGAPAAAPSDAPAPLSPPPLTSAS